MLSLLIVLWNVYCFAELSLLVVVVVVFNHHCMLDKPLLCCINVLFILFVDFCDSQFNHQYGDTCRSINEIMQRIRRPRPMISVRIRNCDLTIAPVLTIVYL